uniref:G-protein coupled receptors family 1 profile domain-containing protein n=1 Tax=Pyxicephalus adspersus TaxID=30357 RepID=A0AAV3AB20_PYXAD|nr:TPA: hypothetical protein GDO54_013709 [Pyxicephalus adspersus]
MDLQNQSSVKEFTLSGLSHSHEFQVFFFVLFLALYLMTLSGNLLIITAVNADSRLHSPMYFFLSNLSILDMCYSTVTIPKMLANVISSQKTISFNQCISQLFFLHLFGGTECFLLTVMAYDRYLPFCGPNKINHFFCDVHPLAVLACSDTFFIDMFIIGNSGMISLSCFLVLLLSYLGILTTILKIHSSEGRRKAFSTCAAHLLVVTFFFGPCVFIYLRPPVNYPADKLVSVLYTVLTPLLNPIIYTLRNQEVKNAIRKSFRNKLSPQNPKHTDTKNTIKE